MGRIILDSNAVLRSSGRWTAAEPAPDLSLQDTTYSFATEIPTGWADPTNNNGNYNLDFQISNGFLQQGSGSPLVISGGNGNPYGMIGMISPQLWDNPGTDIDVQIQFAWNASADTSNENAGIGIALDPTGTTNNARPADIGVVSDRNFNRIKPSRYHPNTDLSTNWTGMTANNTNVHGLSGSELTADGSTLHTLGFSVRTTGGAALMTTYFDGVEQKAEFGLGSPETAIFNAADRVVIRWDQANVSKYNFKTKQVRIAPRGTIFP